MSESTAERELGAIYRRYGPAIHRRALALLGNEQEALDVTQDSFLAYMEARSSWRGEASPFTILYQIVTYRAVDRLRRRARWAGALGTLELRDEDDAAHGDLAQPSMEGGLAQVEALCDLAILTQGESPEVLSAAVYHFVDGWTLVEVARELGLDRKKVSKMLQQFIRRARQRGSETEARAKP